MMEKSDWLWVKHPPEEVDLDNLPNLFAEDVDDIFVDINAQGNLYTACSRFGETGSPYYAILILLYCQKVGIYPPQSFLDWLEKAFLAWIRSDGKTSMDKAMGLVKGKGQSPAIKQAKTELFERELMIEMEWLKDAFPDVSNLDAAGMVSARLNEEQLNDHQTAYSQSTLNLKFCNWSSERKKSGITHFREFKDSEKSKLLSNYPSYSFEHLPSIRQHYKPK